MWQRPSHCNWTNHISLPLILKYKTCTYTESNGTFQRTGNYCSRTYILSTGKPAVIQTTSVMFFQLQDRTLNKMESEDFSIPRWRLVMSGCFSGGTEAGDMINGASPDVTDFQIQQTREILRVARVHVYLCPFLSVLARHPRMVCP